MGERESALLRAVCRLAGVSVFFVRPGLAPELVVGGALRWMRLAGMADRLGRPRSPLAALMRVTRRKRAARAVVRAGRKHAEVGVERLPGSLYAVLVRMQAGPPALAGAPPREAAVSACVAEGMSNKEIAAALDVSERAVKKHVARALARSGARNRAHLAAMVSAAKVVRLNAR